MRDRGHAAIELALGVGVMLLPAAIVVLAFGPWTERKVAAEALASEAAREAVLQLDQASGMAALQAQATGMGLHPGEVRVGWCGARPAPGSVGVCAMARGTVVAVSVEVWAPLISTPWGAVGGIWVEAGHSEPIDLYRSLG